MDHIAHIKNTGGLDNESVTEETVSEHCKKTALLARSYSAPFNMESTPPLKKWHVMLHIQPRSIWKVQFSFLLYYMTQES